MASRCALIVANGEYRSEKLRRLRAPAHDADALARVLQDPAIGGFEVGLVRDQPEHVLRRRIARFFTERRRDDLLVLHISCHGLKDDDGHLFFAATDTEFDDLESTALPEEFVRRQMAKSRSGRIVLLLDCCYSGAFSRGMAARSGEGVELKERFAGRGRAVITASNAMEYSFEGDDLNGEGEPSVFTGAVVKALETGQADRDHDGWIAFDELYDYVYDEVRGCSPQHPLKWVDLEGELRIARSVYRPEASIAPDDPAPAAPAAPANMRPLDSTGVDATGEARPSAGAEAVSLARVTRPVVVSRREARSDEPWVRLLGARAAAVAAVGGALTVIASLRASSPFDRLTDTFYRLPVAIMAVGVIVLIIGAFYSRRKAALVGATGLALTLLGVTFPLGWPHPSLPRAVGFWVGVCGAAVAAAGAALGSWLACREASPAGDETRLSNRSRAARAAFALTGPLVVLSTLFVLPERSNAQYSTWAKWGMLRYPVLIIVLCAVTIALATRGLWTDRRRWLGIAAIVACLMLGEALPLIYNGVQDWGAGRWLRLVGALLTVAGLALAAATTRPGEPSHR